nr:hypothetical protein 4 [Deltaproteobacteria bacterium]
MATKYVKGDVTQGTGSGTLADPWNINDVLLNTNPKSLSQGDQVLCVFDPTDPENTAFSVNVQLSTWVTGGSTNYNFISGCDLSGNFTKERPIWDCSGIASGAAFYFNHAYSHLHNILLRGGPGSGIAGVSSAADYEFVTYCRIEDMANDGLVFGGGAALCCIYANEIIECGGDGIDGSSLWVLMNYIYKCGGRGIYQPASSVPLHFGNLIVVKEGLSDSEGIYVHNRAATYHNTVVVPGTRTGTNVKGIRLYSGGGNKLDDNLVVGLNAVDDVGIYNAATINYYAGNITYDCTTDIYDGTLTLFKQTVIDQNPVFNDTANDDFTPTASLVGYALRSKLGEETAWLPPGAIPQNVDDGGGGGATASLLRGSIGGPIIRRGAH